MRVPPPPTARVIYDEAGRSAAIQQVEEPSPAAASVIDYFWHEPIARSERQPGWRVVPDPCAHIIYHRHVSGRDRLMLVGARSVFTDVDRSNRCYTLGVRLRPGGLRALGIRNAVEFTDLSVPLRDVDAQWGAELHDQLRADAEPLLQFKGTVEQKLSSHRPDARMEAALAALQQTRGVRAAHEAAELSPRWLRQQLHRQTGLTPKRLQRISRLYCVLQQILNASDPDWARLAVLCGYYDQSHLINEFAELLGESPEQYQRRRDR